MNFLCVVKTTVIIDKGKVVYFKEQVTEGGVVIDIPTCRTPALVAKLTQHVCDDMGRDDPASFYSGENGLNS